MNDFTLIETMRFDPDEGLVRANLHWARLRNSSAKLGFSGAADAWASLLEKCASLVEPSRLRLELFSDGQNTITVSAYSPLTPHTEWRIAIARSVRLDSGQPLLRHKTSERTVYQKARAEFPADEIDEVLLLNELGEICEGTITNIFVEDGEGGYYTPPLSSGCLAGVLRTSMICSKQARVKPVFEADLAASSFRVGNSLRGLIRARLV